MPAAKSNKDVNTTENIFKDSGKSDVQIASDVRTETVKTVKDAQENEKYRLMIPEALAKQLGAVNKAYVFGINGVQYAVHVDGKYHEYPKAAVKHMERVLSSLDKKSDTLPI